MKQYQECEKLAARFEKKAAEGLLDVKFFVSNAAEVALDQLCREANALYDAWENGASAPLDFKDSYRRG
jgi:hypothetical protein